MSPSTRFHRVLGLATVAGACLFAPSTRAQDTSDPPAEESGGAGKVDGATTPDATEGASESEPEKAPAKDEDAGASVSTHARTSTSDIAFDAALQGNGRFRRLWVGIGGSFELVFLSQGNDVCKLTPAGTPASPVGAYCTEPYGADFPARAIPAQNDSLVPGRSGQLGGGAAVGDVRVFVAADYAVTGAILAGLRIGYVFNTYPGDAALGDRPSFLRNVHLEARGTYLFGKDPLTHVAFAPMVFAGAGYAPTDGHALTQVSFAGVRGPTPMNAWQVGGPGFVVVGAGTRYAFSPRAAFSMAWKASFAFGSGTALLTTGPELAFQYGF